MEALFPEIGLLNPRVCKSLSLLLLFSFSSLPRSPMMLMYNQHGNKDTRGEHSLRRMRRREDSILCSLRIGTTRRLLISTLTRYYFVFVCLFPSPSLSPLISSRINLLYQGAFGVMVYYKKDYRLALIDLFPSIGLEHANFSTFKAPRAPEGFFFLLLLLSSPFIILFLSRVARMFQ